MIATIQQNFGWPKCADDIRNYVRQCKHCQANKITTRKQFGYVPMPTNTKPPPWFQVHVDLVGTWTVTHQPDDDKKL